MKTKLLTLLLASVLPAMAAPLTGEKLDVWPGGTGSNTVVDSSGAIGSSLTITGQHSLAVGAYHNIAGHNSLAIGQGNAISGNNSLGVGLTNDVIGQNSAAFGEYNSVNGTNSFVVGGNINANGGGSGFSLYVGRSMVVEDSDASIIAGSYNIVNGNYNSAIFGQGHTATNLSTGLTAGSSNAVSGKQFVLGTGLIAQDTAQAAVVVGQYNLVPSPTPPPGSPKQLFVVGNGTGVGSPQNRKNALEVYTDGSIRMPAAQGDISMGEFAP